MNVVGLVLGWLLGILLGLLTLPMALMRNWLQAIPLLAATLIVLLPVRALMEIYDAKMKVGSGESRHIPAQRSRCGGMMDRPES